MKKKRSKHKLRLQVGWSGGLRDHRYGTIKIGNEEHSLKSRITLAGGAAPATIFRGAWRDAIVSRIMDEMGDWRSTPFQNEGSMRHGLRSSLCLGGHGWQESNAEAVSLVETALRRMGASRPSWEEGQWEYAERRDRCVRCGKDIDAPQTFRGYRFCSDLCARLTLERRNFARRSEDDRLYAAAKRIIAKGKTRPRNCAWCGEVFHPVREASKQTCCCYQHAALLRARKYSIPGRLKEAVTVFCRFCGEQFSTLSARAEHCSRACSQMAGKMKNGYQPEKLKRHVFDHFFTVPVNEQIRLRITSRKFDWMMMERGLNITGEVRIAPAMS